MTEKPARYDADTVQQKIVTIRGQKVILDSDLARIYDVPTKALNQAVKRNADKFPADFMFRLDAQDIKDLKSQIVTSSSDSIRSQFATGSGHGGRRKPSWVFTEHGAIMAATVLNSPRAVQMSVFVVRAFIRMRAALTSTHELARKLAVLERDVKTRLDTHDTAIVDVLRRIMNLIDPPDSPEQPKKKIGFGIKERRSGYRTKRNLKS